MSFRLCRTLSVEIWMSFACVATLPVQHGFSILPCFRPFSMSSWFTCNCILRRMYAIGMAIITELALIKLLWFCFHSHTIILMYAVLWMAFDAMDYDAHPHTCISGWWRCGILSNTTHTHTLKYTFVSPPRFCGRLTTEPLQLAASFRNQFDHLQVIFDIAFFICCATHYT